MSTVTTDQLLPVPVISAAMMEAAVDAYENFTGPCEQELSSMHRRSMRAALEAALAAQRDPVGETLDTVFAEIEAMGWDAGFRLPDRKANDQDRVHCAVGGNGYDGLRRYGPTRLAAFIALRAAIGAEVSTRDAAWPR